MKPLCLLLMAFHLLDATSRHGQNSPAEIRKEETTLTKHAKGTFDVKIVPAESSPIGQGAGVGRMTIDKNFSGALEASSKGEMLTRINENTGSMAYVALERVTGKLDGRSGSFVLMHNGSMLKSDPSSSHLQVVIVPASATDELKGLAGKMTIVVDNTGKHTYDIEYTLP